MFKLILTYLLCVLAPWVAASAIYWGTQGEWLALLGSSLASGAMAALSLDMVLRVPIVRTDTGEEDR